MSYGSVKRLSEERPDWIPIVKECLECSQKYEEFAGSWVLSGLAEKRNAIVWKPGLRTLVAYGILKKIRTTRGGRRAYYIIPDPEGAKKALQEIDL